MALYALGEQTPTIADDAFVHPDAVVIGSVTIGSQSSVWPGAVLRGDDATITIGDRTSIQDGSVIHTVPHAPTRVGDDCVVGHIVHLEGCEIRNRCLVGSGSVVLHHVVLEEGSMVGANAVVTTGTVVPSGALALGIPAKILEGRADPDLITFSALSYTERTARYRTGLRRLD